MPHLVIAFSELQLYVCLVWLHHHQSLVPTNIGVGYMNVASSFGSIPSQDLGWVACVLDFNFHNKYLGDPHCGS